VSDSLLAITPDPIALMALLAAVGDHRDGSDGAVAVFLGVVRGHNMGRTVRYLEYEAYEPMAIRTLERIASEVADRWSGVRLAVHHRTGRLEIGETSVAIAAAAAHRADAFAACRYTIERVKQIAPIWKREVFEGGEVWIEGARADPEDGRALAEAERVACS
jgi:molybdopterin synthase catalytic subunit